jgi:ketosteroid isomerase-like protein
MSVSPAKIAETLLANPTDPDLVRSLTTPDVTYVSLSEHDPDLKAILPWTGTNKGPETTARVFQDIYKTWEVKDFQVRDVVEQGDRAAFFGTFTYVTRQNGREVTSPFSLLAKLTDGKISYMQFLEDTFATSRSVKPQQ